MGPGILVLMVGDPRLTQLELQTLLADQVVEEVHLR
jgi:hypothetical protein